MKIIGVTGKSGSGKTTLSIKLSEQLNCSYISIDKIGHQATNEPHITEILCNKFGKDILDRDTKKINRKKLGDIVFSDKEKMDELTQITWSYMQERLDEILKRKTEYIILEWALLPISKYWNQCDVKIIVQSDDYERKQRVIERDHISEEYFIKRDSNSMNYSEVKSDYIFNNDYKECTIEKMANIIIKNIK